MQPCIYEAAYRWSFHCAHIFHASPTQTHGLSWKNVNERNSIPSHSQSAPHNPTHSGIHGTALRVHFKRVPSLSACPATVTRKPNANAMQTQQMDGMKQKCRPSAVTATHHQWTPEPTHTSTLIWRPSVVFPTLILTASHCPVLSFLVFRARQAASYARAARRSICS